MVVLCAIQGALTNNSFQLEDTVQSFIVLIAFGCGQRAKSARAVESFLLLQLFLLALLFFLSTEIR
jgi:hypothetical protein